LLGFSTEATADALGIATGTVKSRLSRALVALRTELEADDG
jgi:DNA-directed RNA polymerase specialized sigma24 family protein